MRGHHNPNGNLQKVNKMPKAQGIWGPIGNIALKLAKFGINSGKVGSSSCTIRPNSCPREPPGVTFLKLIKMRPDLHLIARYSSELEGGPGGPGRGKRAKGVYLPSVFNLQVLLALSGFGLSGNPSSYLNLSSCPSVEAMFYCMSGSVKCLSKAFTKPLKSDLRDLERPLKSLFKVL